MYGARELARLISFTPSQHVVFRPFSSDGLTSHFARKRTTAAPPPGGMSRGRGLVSPGAEWRHGKRM